MTLSLSGLAPAKIGSTVIPVMDVRVSPEMSYLAFQHSGNEFPSVGAVPGGMPRVSFKTPWAAAYSVIASLKLSLQTTFEIYLATFASGLRNSGALHSKLSLNASCSACCYISGIENVGQNQIAMATIEAVGLSNNGVQAPFQKVDLVSLPSLVSEPALHTLGPLTIAGSRVDGLLSSSYAQNIQLAIPKNDGDSYARTVGWMGAAPRLRGRHQDPIAMLAALGLTGVSISSSAALWLIGIDPTTMLRMPTGMSLTVSSGRIITDPVQLSQAKPNEMDFEIAALSSTSTHPVVVNTSASVP